MMRLRTNQLERGRLELPASDELALDVDELRTRFGSETVLQGVHLTVAQGEVVSLVGASGAGKSTLLNCIAGFLDYSGMIRIQGRIGMQHQSLESSVFRWMTVEQNVSFGLRTLPRSQRLALVNEVLERVGLLPFRRKFPAELSGGQVQRLALARCIAPKPRLLLMDEPYSALDTVTKGEMETWVSEISRSERTGILHVTHDIEAAIRLSRRILILRSGLIEKIFTIPVAQGIDDRTVLVQKQRLLEEIKQLLGASSQYKI